MPEKNNSTSAKGNEAPTKSRQPKKRSIKQFINSKIKASLLSSLYIVIILLINLLVLYLFKWNIWSLYWLNAGFIIILPIFEIFDNIHVTVMDVRSGHSWTETRGLRGVYIGIAILLVTTFIIFKVADAIFPPYNFMKTFILTVVPICVSGGFILRCLLNIHSGIISVRAGRAQLNDPNAPQAHEVLKPYIEKHKSIYKKAILGVAIICILAVIVQYTQVLIFTPKIRNELDTLTIYRESENALPYSDDAILQGKENGEFSDFCTIFETSVSEDLKLRGITGQYTQTIQYQYDYKTEKWGATVDTPSVAIKTANVSGEWAPVDGTTCTDYAGNAKDFKIKLKITSMTTEKVQGTIFFFSGDTQIFESGFEGAVAIKQSDLYTTATMSKGYAIFFDEGHRELIFAYQAFDDSIVITGDFAGHLKRQ